MFYLYVNLLKGLERCEKKQAISGLLDINRDSALALNKGGFASLEPDAAGKTCIYLPDGDFKIGAELLQL